MPTSSMSPPSARRSRADLLVEDALDPLPGSRLAGGWESRIHRSGSVHDETPECRRATRCRRGRVPRSAGDRTVDGGRSINSRRNRRRRSRRDSRRHRRGSRRRRRRPPPPRRRPGSAARFVDGEAAAVVILAVQALDRRQGLVIVVHLHEAESPAPTGLAVAQDLALTSPSHTARTVPGDPSDVTVYLRLPT